MQIQVLFSMHFSECSEKFYDRKFRNCFVGSRTILSTESFPTIFWSISLKSFDDFIKPQNADDVEFYFFDLDRKFTFELQKLIKHFYSQISREHEAADINEADFWLPHLWYSWAQQGKTAEKAAKRIERQRR